MMIVQIVQTRCGAGSGWAWALCAAGCLLVGFDHAAGADPRVPDKARTAFETSAITPAAIRCGALQAGRGGVLQSCCFSVLVSRPFKPRVCLPHPEQL